MLLRHSLQYLAARGLPGLVNFAALFIYTRLLNQADYGRYALVIAGISMVGTIVFQWQRLVLARWLPVHKDDPRRFLGEMLYVFALLSLVTLLVGAIFAVFATDPVWQWLLVLATLLLVVHSWVEFNLILASTQLDPGRYGRVLGSKTLIALLVGTGLAWVGLGTFGPLLGLLAGCLLAILFYGRQEWRGIVPRRPEKTEFQEHLHYGLPLILTFALGWIISSSDRVLIGWLLHVEAVGQYAVGYDLAQQSLGMLLAIVQVAAYPLAVAALEKQGKSAAVEQIRHNGELIMGIALSSAVGMAVLAPQISGLVGLEFRESTMRLLPVIAFGAAIGGIKAFHFDLAFHLGKNSRGLVVCTAITALSNIGLNLLLIPRFGIEGAAYATLFSYVLGVSLSAWMGRRLFNMPPALAIWLRACVVSLAVALGATIGGKLGLGFGGLLAGVVLGGSFGLAVGCIINLAGGKFVKKIN